MGVEDIVLVESMRARDMGMLYNGDKGCEQAFQGYEDWRWIGSGGSAVLVHGVVTRLGAGVGRMCNDDI